MIKRISFSIAVALFLGSLTAFADEPQVEVFELRTPVEHGLSSVHYDNGQVLTSSEYQHGQRHGAVKSYFEWINKLSYEGEFVAGHQHGTTRYWSPQGKLLFESEWKNGKPISGIVWKGALSAGLDKTIRTIQYTPATKGHWKLMAYRISVSSYAGIIARMTMDQPTLT